MTQPFNRAEITEVVVLTRGQLGALEHAMLQHAFPNATIRVASSEETSKNATDLFDGITYPCIVGVVRVDMLVSVFVRNSLSFVYLLNSEGELSVNRGEGGVVSQVFPEPDA